MFVLRQYGPILYRISSRGTNQALKGLDAHMRQLKITKQITNRESESLEKYFQEIGKVDLITMEDEVELAKRIREGDQIALEKMIKANLRFVVSVAKQYQNNGLT